MANRPVYRCAVCNQTVPRSTILVKRVQFAEMGSGGKLLKSRVKGWVCRKCAQCDPDWGQQPFSNDYEQIGI